MVTKHKFLSRYCPLQAFTCQRLNQKGQGIVNFHQKPFYVSELLPGETALIVVYHENHLYGEARAEKLIKTSSHRILPLHHWKFKYGGYNIPHMATGQQDLWKTEQVRLLFGNQTRPIIVGRRRFYRNKVVLHDGGFLPPGPYRKLIIKPDLFDLIKFNWDLVPTPPPNNLIIRKLGNRIIMGRPGDKKYIFDQMLGVQVRIGLNAFYQVNSEMAQQAYQKIKSFCCRSDHVLDLFSGIGTISLILSNLVCTATAVEINHESFADAKYNVHLNHLSNIVVVHADANQFLQTISPLRYSVLILDPGRAGVAAEALRTANRLSWRLIIYLSCNITSQARDLKLLSNYQIIMIQPYDFFPQTYHVENLVVLKPLPV